MLLSLWRLFSWSFRIMIETLHKSSKHSCLRSWRQIIWNFCLIETYYAFFFFPISFSVYLFLQKILKIKKKSSKSTPTEAPLSHSKHCSWNASSVVPPLILWICDITLCHRVTHLYNLCPAASLACKNWFSTAALLLSAVLAQACWSWPIREDWLFRRRSLKETVAKTERFRQKGNTELQQWSTRKPKCFVSSNGRKPVLVVTHNISILCLLLLINLL